MESGFLPTDTDDLVYYLGEREKERENAAGGAVIDGGDSGRERERKARETESSSTRKLYVASADPILLLIAAN